MFTTTSTTHLSREEAATLVARAAGGDRQAWNSIVDAHEGLVWSIARGHGLRGDDAGDVCQTVWLRLIEHIDRISDPARVGAWLATTARRECWRVQARARRMVTVGGNEASEFERGDDGELDAQLVREETRDEVRAALEQLPARHQTLLRLLMAEPPPSYHEIATALGIPIGSIGPTRGRCLRKLRDLLGEEIRHSSGRS